MSEIVCTNAHDRCGTPDTNCPYCEWEPGPPKRWRSWRVCPTCGSRTTKLFHLSSGKYECQICGCKYNAPERTT